MSRITISMRVGFILAIISFLIGCAQFQELVYPQIASKNQKIEQLTTQLQKSLQTNRASKQENQKLRSANLRLMKNNTRLEEDNRQLMDANSNLKTGNRELARKIDMLKILDHDVEEKRKIYTSD